MNKTNQHIALFPLKLFLLPGERTQLYIFEDRYKQLINDCKQNNEPFGISFTNKINAANIGSLVEVTEVLQIYPGGEMDIIVKATGLFRLLSFNIQKSGKLYPGGDADLSIEIENEPVSVELEEAFTDFLKKDESLNSSLLAKPNFTLLDVAIELMLSEMDKLDFCLCNTTEERERFLLNYIRYISFLEGQERSTYHNIYLN